MINKIKRKFCIKQQFFYFEFYLVFTSPRYSFPAAGAIKFPLTTIFFSDSSLTNWSNWQAIPQILVGSSLLSSLSLSCLLILLVLSFLLASLICYLSCLIWSSSSSVKQVVSSLKTLLNALLKIWLSIFSLRSLRSILRISFSKTLFFSGYVIVLNSDECSIWSGFMNWITRSPR